MPIPFLCSCTVVRALMMWETLVQIPLPPERIQTLTSHFSQEYPNLHGIDCSVCGYSCSGVEVVPLF